MGVYVDDYLDWVEERRTARDAKYEGYAAKFYVSNLGTCRRKQIWMRDRVPGRPMTRNKKRFFEDRQALHDLRILGWWVKGRTLAADLTVGGVYRGYSITKLLPDDFGGRPDIIGHLAEPKDCEYLRGCWTRMVEAHALGKGEWTRYRDELRSAGVDVTDNKTANPNMVKYADNFPKKFDIGQVGCYALTLNESFDLGIDRVRLVYTPVGSAEDDLEYELPLPTREETGIDEEFSGLVFDWRVYKKDTRENPFARTVPDVLPLALEERRESYERVKKKYWRTVLTLQQSWECGYCLYSGAGCVPNKTVLEKGDRIAILEDRRLEIGGLTYVESWCKKAGYAVPTDAESIPGEPKGAVETDVPEETLQIAGTEVE